MDWNTEGIMRITPSWNSVLNTRSNRDSPRWENPENQLKGGTSDSDADGCMAWKDDFQEPSLSQDRTHPILQLLQHRKILQGYREYDTDGNWYNILTLRIYDKLQTTLWNQATWFLLDSLLDSKVQSNHMLMGWKFKKKKKQLSLVVSFYLRHLLFIFISMPGNQIWIMKRQCSRTRISLGVIWYHFRWRLFRT